jgi:hypothetical protein
MKATGERNAGNPHVAFEVAGAGNGMMEDSKRARNRKRGNKPRVILHIAAPALDPTGASSAFSFFSISFNWAT